MEEENLEVEVENLEVEENREVASCMVVVVHHAAKLRGEVVVGAVAVP